MTFNCHCCGKDYEAKRKRSKFCSTSCRVKTHKKLKMLRVAAPNQALPAVYVPTGAESILTLWYWRHIGAISKLKALVSKLAPSPEAEAIQEMLRKIDQTTTPETVLQVTGHDMNQRINNPDAFKQRTGLPEAHLPPLA